MPLGHKDPVLFTVSLQPPTTTMDANIARFGEIVLPRKGEDLVCVLCRNFERVVGGFVIDSDDDVIGCAAEALEHAFDIASFILYRHGEGELVRLGREITNS